MNGHARSLSFLIAATVVATILHGASARAEPVYFVTIGQPLPVVNVSVTNPFSTVAEPFTFITDGPDVGAFVEMATSVSPTSSSFSFPLFSFVDPGFYTFSAERADNSFDVSFYAIYKTPAPATPIVPGTGTVGTLTGTALSPISIPTGAVSGQVQVSVDGGQQVTTIVSPTSGLTLVGLSPGEHTVVVFQNGSMVQYTVDIDADLPEPLSAGLLATGLAVMGVARRFTRERPSRATAPSSGGIEV